jgi:hypothetical protein
MRLRSLLNLKRTVPNGMAPQQNLPRLLHCRGSGQALTPVVVEVVHKRLTRDVRQGNWATDENERSRRVPRQNITPVSSCSIEGQRHDRALFDMADANERR